MRCFRCGKNKLSREFPSDTVAEACEHPAIYCLKCTIECVKQHGNCPDEDCCFGVPPNGPEIQLYEAILGRLFYDESASFDGISGENGIEGGSIIVSLMNGDRHEIPFRPDMTVFDLKEILHTKYRYDRNKQRLKFNGKELKLLTQGGVATLADFGVSSGSVIHLLLALFAIPNDLNHVIFDLYWGVPADIRCDFLDASCFIYGGQRYIDVIDYVTEKSSEIGDAVMHTGDEFDRIRRVGQHRIEVRLKDLPKEVTHLVFTLSAWDSKSISKFITPTLCPSMKLFDARNIFKDLCRQTLSESSSEQAVVVCCVYRFQDRWTVFESGYQTGGNSDNYEPIKAAIENFVLKMC